VTPSVVQSEEGTSADIESEEEIQNPEHFGGKDDLQLRKAIEILMQSSSSAKAA